MIKMSTEKSLLQSTTYLQNKSKSLENYFENDKLLVELGNFIFNIIFSLFFNSTKLETSKLKTQL